MVVQRSSLSSPRSTRKGFFTAIVGVLMLVFGMAAGTTIRPSSESTSASSSFADQPAYQTLEETWTLLQDNFADPSLLDDQALLYGAASGMLEAVGDDGHTSFMDPADAKVFRASLNGELIGIGVQLDFDGAYPRVLAPIRDSPADLAGVDRGDLIIEVDGVSTKGWSDSQTSSFLRGEEGQEVVLTIERPSTGEEFSVTLVRSRIRLDPVESAWLPGDIALIRLNDFSAGASKELGAALDGMVDDGAAGIVLDLRANPGGYVHEAIAVASEFLPEGTTVYLHQERGGEPKPVASVGGYSSAIDLPLVVLVDEGSASSAELVAAAMRDNDRAEIVGETTFGTGTVVTSFDLDDGSIAAIGTAFWLTPSGEQIWKQGLEPDQLVRLPVEGEPVRFALNSRLSAEQIEAFQDDQLLAALATLSSESAGFPVDPRE